VAISYIILGKQIIRLTPLLPVMVYLATGTVFATTPGTNVSVLLFDFG
jgi:hypothetical protein